MPFVLFLMKEKKRKEKKIREKWPSKTKRCLFCTEERATCTHHALREERAIKTMLLIIAITLWSGCWSEELSIGANS
jgi:hypothetical protein